MSPAPRSIPILAVVGATASGKSAVALDVAETLPHGAEIINADAMALYRGMDIGTAKTPERARRGIPHHLLDVLDVTDEASVAAYQRDARAAIEDVRSRGRVPVLVGGSGLYVRAVLDRLEIPPTDPVVRARLEAECAALGLEVLRARLERLDPAAAAVILASNTRRTIRALEVVEITGRPFAATLPEREFASPAVLVGLRVPRPVLDERIATRVGDMWHGGLVSEVHSLIGRGLRRGPTAARALGYSQALGEIDGLLTQEQAMEQTRVATRTFAKRQQSWFGADPRIVWVDQDRPDLVAKVRTSYLEGQARHAGHD